MIRARIPAVCIVVLLGGCATAPKVPEPIDIYELDSSAIEQVVAVTVFPPSVEISEHHVDLGDVVGIHCQERRSAGSNANTRVANRASTRHTANILEAKEQVKIHAVLRGADAISYPRCRTVRTPNLPEHCQIQWICSANAYRQRGLQL